MSEKFDSDGFDLDATTGSGDAILEIGGGSSSATPNVSKSQPENGDIDPRLEAALECKKHGNNAFKEKNWLEAYDRYTEAIEATPGEPKGDEIRGMYTAWLEERQKQMRADLEKQEAERRKAREKGEAEEPKQQRNNNTAEPQFVVDPQHPHAPELSTFFCNRAATLLHMHRYLEAKEDCDVSIWLNPSYVKAYTRRSTAHEQLVLDDSATADDTTASNSNNYNTEAALKDSKKALELDPGNRVIRANVQRLEKIEAERLEKLKTETLGKLKDLGNSILGNFGLSLDNFQTTQDPQTGSYSINFNQNNSGGGGGGK